MKPLETIQKFDRFLGVRDLSFNAVVIGGAALSILGVITRETQDVDVLDPEIPFEVIQAAKEFAIEQGIQETSLKESWLNAGPESLRRYLRSGWRLRLQPLFSGHSIEFQTLGRIDLVGTKVLAYCDRGQDLDDCLRLNPTREELLEILPWVSAYDGHPNWSQYVHSQFDDLARRLGYGL
jgi:hypothetical protein